MPKPAGLTYAVTGFNGQDEAIAYLVTDAATAALDGFDYAVTYMGHPLAQGFDYAAEPNDGGVLEDGSPPAVNGDYAIFVGGQDKDALIANYGWNPFDPAYRTDTTDLPLASELVAAAMAAPVTPIGPVERTPLPGYPGLVYERYFEDGAQYGYVMVGLDTDPAKAFALFDADGFADFFATDREASVNLFVSYEGAVGFFTDGYWLGGGANNPTPAERDGEPLRMMLEVYDYGPYIRGGENDGYTLWSFAPENNLADYPWPGVFSGIGAAVAAAHKPANQLVKLGFTRAQALAMQSDLSELNLRTLMYHGFSYRQARTLQRGDMSLNALIRGGFTRTQARELTED